jgi:hypothetical protein
MKITTIGIDLAKNVFQIHGVDDLLPYYSPASLHQAFDGIVEDSGDFTWKGIELFWGTKPQR